MSPATMTGAATAPTQLIHAKKATYAYRRFGHGAARPLLFLQHFVGTLDNWDPAVTDPLATGREVVLFDNAGVGRSTGSVPGTVSEMSAHALDFLNAVRIDRCDVIGFSLGGMVAQEMVRESDDVAAVDPDRVQKIQRVCRHLGYGAGNAAG